MYDLLSIFMSITSEASVTFAPSIFAHLNYLKLNIHVLIYTYM